MKLKELKAIKRGKASGNGRKRGLDKRRIRRRVEAENNAIQRLFQVTRLTFRGDGFVTDAGDVKFLQMFLDRMKPEDFGLSTDLEFFKATSPEIGSPTITYSTIYNCDDFSMCMFFLPPKAVIPLHNHPGMTVCSKLLLGTMHIKSYDFVEDSSVSEKATQSNFRLVKKVVDSEFVAPCKTSTLYPTSGGNMHKFTAITPCVFLDVLGPPYSKKDDRDCTYYRDHPYSYISGMENEEQDKSLGWLEEIEMPKDLKMVGVEYMGPPIFDR